MLKTSKNTSIVLNVVETNVVKRVYFFYSTKQMMLSLHRHYGASAT